MAPAHTVILKLYTNITKAEITTGDELGIDR